MQYDNNIARFYTIAIAIERTIGRDWYPTMAREMDRLAAMSGLSARQCADIFGANSINTEWTDNKRRAERNILSAAKGETVTGGHFKFVVGYVNRIIAGESLADCVKDATALKIRNFSPNLCNDPDYITIDRWAFRIATDFADCENTDNRDARGIPFGCAKNGLHGCGKVPKGKEYTAIADAYRRVAAQFNERPLDLQAITWVVVTGTAA